MLSVVEQIFDKALLSRLVPTVRLAKIQGLFQTKSVAKSIVQAVLSNTRFVVPIAEAVGRMVDRLLEECIHAILRKCP